MAERYSGKAVAEAMAGELSARAARLREQDIVPRLVLLRVGEEPGSLAYEKGARKTCEALGVTAETLALPGDSETAAVLAAIDEINADESIHGCLLLQPLPARIDAGAVCERLAAEKDVDGVTSRSLAGVFTGRGGGFAPCTAEAVIALLDHYGVPLEGARVTVIGRSLVVGRPLAMLLTARNATVTLCHSRTRELPALGRTAEILVAAAGHAGLVDGTFVSPGQVLVDVGTSTDENGRLCGDVCFAQAEPLARAISPVPGGVGAVTTSILVRHVLEAAEHRLPAYNA